MPKSKLQEVRDTKAATFWRSVWITCLMSIGVLISGTFWDMNRSSDCTSMGCLTTPAIVGTGADLELQLCFWRSSWKRGGGSSCMSLREQPRLGCHGAVSRPEQVSCITPDTRRNYTVYCVTVRENLSKHLSTPTIWNCPFVYWVSI